MSSSDDVFSDDSLSSFIVDKGSKRKRGKKYCDDSALANTLSYDSLCQNNNNKKKEQLPSSTPFKFGSASKQCLFPSNITPIKSSSEKQKFHKLFKSAKTLAPLIQIG